jgi:DNA-binding MarR family transcriptional regulator
VADVTDEPRWLTPTEDEAWRAVMSLVLLLPSRLDQQLQRDVGISFFEYLVMSMLSMSEGRKNRMTELAAVTNSSLSRLSNVVKRLEAQGWVTRKPDPDDGRSTVATLTAAGYRVVVKAAPGHVEAVRHYVFDVLSPAQVRALAGAREDLFQSLHPDC